MKIISGLLLLVSVFFSVQHGWSAVTQRVSAEQARMMANLGIGPTGLALLGGTSLLVAGLILFPPTFLVGNLLSAASILLLLGLALHVGNLQLALAEVPFLLLPLALIWLKHPLAS